MTTYIKSKTKCRNCESEIEISIITSSSTFGSSDLDTRPPEMMRYGFYKEIVRCSECGCCFSVMQKIRANIQEILGIDEYKKQLNNSKYPEHANSFLCKAIIDREYKDYAESTWAIIKAAWVCDDKKFPKKAIICRQKAVEMLLLAEEHQQPISNQKFANVVLLVELLRRAKNFDKAQQIIESRISSIDDENLKKILDFESKLIKNKDSLCHRISEAFEK